MIFGLDKRAFLFSIGLSEIDYIRRGNAIPWKNGEIVVYGLLGHVPWHQELSIWVCTYS